MTLAARARGAIVRPLGDVVVLMPPLSIEADVLEELVEITADAIAEATAVTSELRAAAKADPQSSYGTKSFLRAPHTGQNQSSGICSNAVPGAMPPSGSPSAGS